MMAQQLRFQGTEKEEEKHNKRKIGEKRAPNIEYLILYYSFATTMNEYIQIHM